MAIKAQVSFGLIQIPVRVETMTSEKRRTSFKTLHSTCTKPINEQKVCRSCGVDVEAGETVKGYEVTKGNFVTFTAEELDTIAAEKSTLVEIVKFVPAPDPAWVEREYWLPGEDPSVEPLARTYATFCDALEESGMVGIGKANLWGRERPVTVSASLRMLTLQILHTQDEWNDTPLPMTATVREAEFTLLLAQIGEFTDTIEESDVEVSSDVRLKEMVAAKVTGGQYTPPEAVEVAPPTVDLLDTLKQMKTGHKKSVTKKKVTA